MTDAKFLTAVFFLTLFVMAGVASAATYIVAKDGSGNFNTIQQAANMAVAGDTVQVKAGTYNEQVIVKNSGTAGNPITFKNYGSDVVWVVQPKTMATYQGVFWIKNKNYITVEGFKIRGGYYGINLDVTDHVIIRNNYVENSKDSPIKLGWGKWTTNAIIDGNTFVRTDDKSTINYGETISISWSDGVEVKNNYVRGNPYGEGIDMKDGTKNSLIHHNLVEKTTAVGIYTDGYADGISNIEVYNNLVRDNAPFPNYGGTGSGIAVGSEAGGLVQNINIHNNEVCGAGHMEAGIAFSRPPYQNFQNINIKNNNAYGSTWVNYFFPAPSNGVTTSGNTENPCSMADPRGNPALCTPNWKCESPLNGYESDGCNNRRQNSACNTAASKIKIMPLGDSITYLSYSYREKLWTSLSGAGYQTDFVGSQSSGTNIPDKDNEGHNGWSTVEVSPNIDAWMTSSQPQYILLHIGTNDVSNALFGGNSISSAQTRLAGIIDKIYAKSPATKVLLATIIPSRDCMTSWNNPADYGCGQNALTGDYNSRVRAVANQKISEGKPVYLVDMYNEAGIDVNSDLSDAVHPNQKGADKMAVVWFNHLKPILGSGQPTTNSLTLKPGWNQISSPIAAGIDLATIESSCTILQYKSQKLWSWNAQAQSWINPTKVEPLKGYWIYAAYVCTVPLSGTPATFSSLQLYNGWNKISASGALSEISGTCAGHMVGNWIWNWDKTTTPEKWIHPAEMQLDKGYWIKVDADCVLG